MKEKVMWVKSQFTGLTEPLSSRKSFRSQFGWNCNFSPFNSAPDSVSKDWAEIFPLSAAVSLMSVELKLTGVGSPFSGSLVNQHEILKARGTAQPGFPKVFTPSEEEISPSLLHLALQKGSDGASPLPTPFLLLENLVFLPVDLLESDINLGHVVLWVVGDTLDGSFHHWMWRRQEVVMEQKGTVQVLRAHRMKELRAALLCSFDTYYLHMDTFLSLHCILCPGDPHASSQTSYTRRKSLIMQSSGG